MTEPDNLSVLAFVAANPDHPDVLTLTTLHSVLTDLRVQHAAVTTEILHVQADLDDALARLQEAAAFQYLLAPSTASRPD